MRQLPKPKDSTRLRFVGEEAFVFDRHHGSILSLNPTAALVWMALEKGSAEDQAVSFLMGAGKLDSSRAKEAIRQSVTNWMEYDLLEGEHPQQSCVPARTQSGHSKENYKSWSEPKPQLPEMTSYRVWDTIINIHCEDGPVKDVVRTVLGHLKVAPVEAPDLEFEIFKAGSSIVVLSDDRILYRCRSEQELGPILNSVVFSAIAARTNHLCVLHAAAVAKAHAALLLVGPAGSGKTTLTAALLRRGFTYLTDDWVGLRDDLTVRGFPLALCMKAGSVDALSDLYPGLAGLRQHVRWDAQTIRYQAPPALEPMGGKTGYPIAKHVIFPKYSPDSSNKWRNIPSGEAFKDFIYCCSNLNIFEENTLDYFISWAESMSFHELCFKDLEYPLSHIEELVNCSPERDTLGRSPK